VSAGAPGAGSVLYVNQTAQVSGAERSLLTLLEHLPSGLQAALACPEGDLARAVRGLGLPVEPVPGTDASFRMHPAHTSRALLELWRSSRAVRSLVRARRPDVVHANTTRAGLIALRARRGGPPLLVHVRDWVPEGRVPELTLRALGRGADLVLANSRWIAELIGRAAPSARVEVLHNPVDLRRFDPERVEQGPARDALGLPDEGLVLSVVAQLTPWKGQADALRVLAVLLERGLDVRLVLAGSAKFVAAGTRFDNRAFERELHETAGQLGVEGRVVFAGEREDVPGVLRATDVLLLPSWREAFGRIAAEAMAMGVPVVATQVGGPAEIVRDGLDGLLLAPRQPDRWAAAVERLLLDPDLRREMGRNGRLRARQEFSAERHVDALLDHYATLRNGRARAAFRA
jgi:glycosyltransferase involved in cell wall biosynthesis